MPTVASGRCCGPWCGPPPARASGARGGRPTAGRPLITLAASLAGLAAAAGALAWLIAGGLLGLEGEQLTAAIAAASGAGAVLATVFGQPLFDAGLTALLAGRESRAPLPVGEELDRCCVAAQAAILRRRVRGPGSQREQMLRGGPLIGLPVTGDLELRADRTGRPRVRRGEAGEPWEELIERWHGSRERLVVLGDPGYGKTFAALGLVERVNRAGDLVAELFALGEWHTWSAGRESASIEDWIVERLAGSYPEITADAARAILWQGRLLAVFDGLDEVPRGARPGCRDALEAYAGRTPPLRPFVLTSRHGEYFALAPRWVGAERHVALTGLDREGILSVLREAVGGLPEWGEAIDAVEGGHEGLLGLLRSPLRLAAALEAYRAADPSELFELAALPDAGERLWDLLLVLGMPGFRGASRREVRRWLAFLAAGLASHERQRLWLHELYLYCSPTDRRRFRQAKHALLGALLATPLALSGSAAGWIGAGAIAAGLAVTYLRMRDRPMDHVAPRPMRPSSYLKALPGVLLLSSFYSLGFATMFAAATMAVLALAGLAGDPIDLGAAAGVVIEIMAICAGFGALGGTGAMLALAGGSNVAEEPPRHLAGAGPGAVIAATRDFGLRAGALAALLIAAPIWLLAPHPRQWWPVPATIGLVAAWAAGLETWAFHHWARLRLARAGLLPYRLREFLEWAREETGWLRGGEAYEFRHRELRDYLAREGVAVGAENVSWEDSPEVRRSRESLARVQVQRAEKHARKGDYEAAHRHYEAARELDPLNREAKVGKARSPLTKET